MPRSDRSLIVAAIFGLVVTCTGLGAIAATSDWTSPPPQKNNQAYAAAKRRYADAIAGKRIDPQPDYAANPDKHAAECYYAKNHDSADLCAQWRAAMAAEEAATTAWWSVWVTIAGTLLSGGGLVALIFALRQTERSLKLARDEHEISQAQFKAAFKPWLAVKAFGPWVAFAENNFDATSPSGRRGDIICRAYVEIDNISAQICVITRATFIVKEMVVNTDHHLYRELRPSEKIIFNNSGEITERKRHVFDVITMTPETFHTVMRNPPPYIGRIEYTDAIGTRRVLGFAFRPSMLTSDRVGRWGGPDLNYDVELKQHEKSRKKNRHAIAPRGGG